MSASFQPRAPSPDLDVLSAVSAIQIPMFPHRRTLVHLPLVEIFNRPNIVFITVCTKARKPILCCPDVHKILIDSWLEADRWRIGRYVVMPDHIHLFCSPAGLDYPPLKVWVQLWKSLSSRFWPRRDEQPVWLRSFWDTQVRTGRSYEEKLEYVKQNPVRARLCHEPNLWPYQGELNILEWFG